MSSAWFWSLLLVGGTVLLSIAGTLMVRRLISVEVLERHNEVAGFIYAVIGVVYAVLLGFAAITVWERYDRAQASVEQEANDLADLYRDAQTFPSDTRAQLESQIRDYVRLAVQKESQLWLTANQVPKFGVPTFSCGGRITNLRLELIRKRLGTRSRSQN
jgi:predicted membrane chloride channel (bestrophin family)